MTKTVQMKAWNYQLPLYAQINGFSDITATL